MNTKLEMLRVFQTVAEKGSLAAAADTLNRTPAAISMTLSQLTATVGAPLFETDRKNRLTPLGRLVLQECHRAPPTPLIVAPVPSSGMSNVAFVQPENPPVHRVLRKIRHEDRPLSPVAEEFWNTLE